MSDCPSMFFPTLTQGGWLSRLRLIGGKVTSDQIDGILAWVQDGTLEITRRGNLQHRSIVPPSSVVLQNLQDLQLIGHPATDHLRNIMLSPMAGLDGVDLSCLAKEWEVYLCSHPELQPLSAKFSLGLDGGETLSIRSFYNDVLVSAIDRHTVEVCLLGKEAIVIPLEEVLSILSILADIYLEFTIKAGRPIRLKDVYSKTDIWQMINDRLKQNYQPYNLTTRQEIKTNYLGILPQNHPDFVAIGVTIPLGRLSSQTLRYLQQITDRFGKGELRFTPWQSVLIPSIHRSFLPDCLQTIDNMHLSLQPMGVSACAGLACQSSWTDTQADAQNLTELFPNTSFFLHLSGCNKLCAYATPHQLLAIGVRPHVYALYRGEELIGEFSREVLTNVKHFL